VTAGLSEGYTWLSSDWLLSTFVVKKSEAVRLYRRFVLDGKKQAKPWTNLKKQVYFGDQEFVDRMRKQVSKDKDLS
jgi:putative transposase